MSYSTATKVMLVCNRFISLTHHYATVIQTKFVGKGTHRVIMRYISGANEITKHIAPSRNSQRSTSDSSKSYLMVIRRPNIRYLTFGTCPLFAEPIPYQTGCKPVSDRIRINVFL